MPEREPTRDTGQVSDDGPAWAGYLIMGVYIAIWVFIFAGAAFGWCE